MKTKRFVLVGVVLGFFVLGTANAGKSKVIQAYPGPARTTSEIAIFRCSFNTVLKAVDGNKKYKAGLFGKVTVLPGTHEFTIGFNSLVHRVRSRKDTVIEFTLEKGRIYDLMSLSETEGGKVKSWKMRLMDVTPRSDPKPDDKIIDVPFKIKP